MKKHISRILVLVLVLAMVASFALPAFAEEPTHTVTINGQKEGHTYEAYQIFSGKISTTGGILSNIVWGESINGDAFLAFLTDPARLTDKIFSEVIIVDGVEKEILNVFAGKTSAEDVAKVLQGYGDKDSMLDTFAKYAANFLKKDAADKPIPAGVSTASGTTYTISGLKSGYYLFMDKAGSVDETDDFYTKFMLEVTDGTAVTVKGSVPTIDKKVSDSAEGTYSEELVSNINDVVYFELSASLPSNFDIFDNYYFTFVDTMSKGLEFNKIEKVYIQRTGEQVDITDAFINDGTGAAAVTATPVGTDGETTFTVKIGDLKDKAFPDLLLTNKIVIRYSATVNSEAKIGVPGNPNEVTLKYSNNPYHDGEGSTGPDDAIVFTFGVNVNKFDKAETTKLLNNAKFVLYRRNLYTDGGVSKLQLSFATVANGKVTGWHTIDGILPGANAMITWNSIVADTTKMPAEVLAKITLTTQEIGGTEGRISVAGLDEGVYHLLEIEAPDGYNLPHEPFVITITPTKDTTTGKINGMEYEFGSATKDDADKDGFAEIDIGNGKGNTLPSTGGIGTTIFYVLGSVMALGAAVILVSKRRMAA